MLIMLTCWKIPCILLIYTCTENYGGKEETWGYDMNVVDGEKTLNRVYKNGIPPTSFVFSKVSSFLLMMPMLFLADWTCVLWELLLAWSCVLWPAKSQLLHGHSSFPSWRCISASLFFVEKCKPCIKKIPDVCLWTEFALSWLPSCQESLDSNSGLSPYWERIE